jgi:phenylpyruvate tautomerase PptA (4-oxalocrotonate tautomerase family)
MDKAVLDGAALSRRAVLLAGSAAAGSLAAGSASLAETPSFGAPLVELTIPADALSAGQKAAMIKGITDVVFGAMGLAQDPSRRLFVEVFETSPGGFGVNGNVFVPRRGG